MWVDRLNAIQIFVALRRAYQFLVEISTTECSEAPSATQKVAMEKTSAKYQPPQTRLSGDLQDTATNINAIGVCPQLWRMGNGGSRVEVERV